MAKKYPFKHRTPKFSVGDTVDVKVDPIGVMTPDNWDQGKITHVWTYQAGPVYEVKSFRGTVIKAEEDDLRMADV